MVVGDGEGWLTELSTDDLARAVHPELRGARGRRVADEHGEPIGRMSPPDEPVWWRDARARRRAAAAIHGHARAASRSTPPAAPWRARGGRSGSSRCWSRSGSAAGWPAGPHLRPAGPDRLPRRRRRRRRRAGAGQPAAAVPGADRRPGVRQGASGPRWRRRWSPTRRYAAAMLAGEMPREIEDVVAARRLSLFPASAATSPWTAPAPTRPCRASTSPRCSTCSPSGSTPTRSRCWRCAGATARRCSTTCAPAAPGARAPPLPADPVAFYAGGTGAPGRTAHAAGRAARPGAGPPAGRARPRRRRAAPPALPRPRRRVARVRMPDRRVHERRGRRGSRPSRHTPATPTAPRVGPPHLLGRL